MLKESTEKIKRRGPQTEYTSISVGDHRAEGVITRAKGKLSEPVSWKQREESASNTSKRLNKLRTEAVMKERE